MSEIRKVATRKEMQHWREVLCMAPAIDNELSAGDKLIGLRLSMYFNFESGLCFPSVKDALAPDTATTRKGAQISLDRLERGRWIRRTERPGTSSLYHFLLENVAVVTDERGKEFAVMGCELQYAPHRRGCELRCAPDANPNSQGVRTPVRPNLELNPENNLPANRGRKAVGAPEGAAGLPLGPQIQAEIRKRIPSERDYSWFRDLTIHALADRVVTIAAPTPLTRQKVIEWHDKLLKSVQAIHPTVERISVVVRASPGPAIEPPRAAQGPPTAAAARRR